MGILQITPQFREGETHTSQTLTLDQVRVRLDTYTNKHDGCWYFDMFDDEGAAMIQGVAIVTGLDLLFSYRYLPVPPGILFVQDQTGAPKADPGLTDFLEGNSALFYQEING